MFSSLFERWLEKLFLVLVIVSVIALSVVLINWLVSEKSLPLTELVVQGDRAYVSDSELQKALKDIPNGGNFFTLDVTGVQQKVENLPWVRRAAIRKQWPNRLMIYLHEQKAVAWWNDQSFINEQGELFIAPMLLDSPLVFLSGPEQSETKVLEAYLQLQKLLETTDFEIANVVLGQRHDWQVELKRGLKLVIGQKNMLERVQLFMDVYSLIEHKELIEYLDLRYDTGIAVGYKK